MKGGKQPQGYTIVEVLIFMAVSGMMFVMAAIFINGKQANVQFRQGMLDVNSQIQAVINEVSNGEYDPLTNGSCLAPGGGGYPSIFSGVAAKQGTNGGASGCIFIGKVMQFDVGNVSTRYDVYTLAARQMDASGNTVNSFATARPIPVTSPIDLTDRKTTQDGLDITHAYLCRNPDCTSHQPIGAFGIFGSFNSELGVASGSQQSGSQSVVVAAIPNTTFGESEANMGGVAAPTPDSIRTNAPLIDTAGTTLGNGKFILLCFTDGTKLGSVTIGGSNGQQFTTEAKTNGIFVLGAGHVC